MPRRIAAFLALAIVLTSALVWSQWKGDRVKVSGFVEADEIRVGSRVGGRVAKVSVIEGATVKKGDVLLEFEPFDLREQKAQAAALLAQRQRDYEKMNAGNRPEEVAQAQARMQQLQANLAKLKAGPRKQEIAAAKAELQLAEAELVRARMNNDRVQALFKNGAATPDQRDQAQTEFRVASATVTVRTEHLQLLEEGTRPEDIDQAEAQLREATEAANLAKIGFRQEDIMAAKAAMESARAALEAIDRKMQELTVVSPVDGIVEAVELQPGDLVAPNAPALSMVDMTTLRVRAYVPENHLGVQLGQELDVRVDSYPKRTFKGKVTFIARQAEFTPGNVQTPEERSKQVFRVRIELDNHEKLLRPGMAADVWLDPGQ
ncbi:MAG: efflux RND transporter periplasmic adaptor subunit [Planctomycetaceae bacterium]|nr:efflux RND transporter periplasmic adaptor subunit [Planctomycetaceae bacterium]